MIFIATITMVTRSVCEEISMTHINKSGIAAWATHEIHYRYYIAFIHNIIIMSLDTKKHIPDFDVHIFLCFELMLGGFK